MNLTFTEYATRVETRATIKPTLYQVTRVRKSSSGFKTSTGTTRTCADCRMEAARMRDQGDDVAGVEKYQLGVWLLEGEGPMGERSELTLCSDHFSRRRTKRMDEGEAARKLATGGNWTRVTTPAD